MNVKMVGIYALSLVSFAAVAERNICWVDTFKAMRECDEGIKVGKELDAVRERLSNEIRQEAEKLAAEEKEFKSKLPTMKKEVAERTERDLSKKRRALEDRVRDGEEELKITMQNKTEGLATKVEESIISIAKEKGVDAVIDKMTGRMLYTKENDKGDLTADAIARVNKSTAQKETTVASKKDTKAAVAA